VTISRFEVWLAQLDPTLGHEIKKTRPCLIISPNEINHANWTMIVAPLSSQIKDLPTRIQIEFDGKPGQVLLDQIRSVDPKRLIKHLGKLDHHVGTSILQRLQDLFSI
jgi:mRNA interferase MazF